LSPGSNKKKRSENQRHYEAMGEENRELSQIWTEDAARGKYARKRKGRRFRRRGGRVRSSRKGWPRKSTQMRAEGKYEQVMPMIRALGRKGTLVVTL